MRKTIWMILFSMMFLNIVDDESGGSGDLDDDIGDFEIEDDIEIGDQKDEADETKKVDDPPDVDKEKLARLEAFQAEIEAERAVATEVGKLSEKYDDFDVTKVTEHLKKMSPEDQELYNNPLGWENIHLTHFKKQSAQFDPFDAGRGVAKEPFDFSKAYEQFDKGDRSVMKDLVANSR